MPKTYMNSFPPPFKATWWERLALREGDVWEQRTWEFGVWDEDYIARWVWNGKVWVQEEEVDIPVI